MRIIVTDGEQCSCTTEVIDNATHITITDKIVVDSSDYLQRLKIVLFFNDLSANEVSKRLGVFQHGLVSKCRIGKFTFDELRQFADAMECKIVIKFIFDDGTEITGDSARSLIVNACIHAGISLTELGVRLGKTRQALNERLNKGRFTHKEMTDIANGIGCNYSNYFELENGMRI